jgi:hypothetical protein
MVRKGELLGEDKSKMFKHIAPIDFLAVFSRHGCFINPGDELFCDYEDNPYAVEKLFPKSVDLSRFVNISKRN